MKRECLLKVWKMKFGLMTYDYTTNLGNEIQSIAARQYLPTIDYCIDHEKLNLFQAKDKVKMIMNGWYLDCLNSWPPAPSIEPLLISMHFNSSINDTIEVITSKESRDFFSTYGPVGCRDYSTLNLLNELDIDAYYSGCLTLTLQKRQKETKSDKKYVVVNAYNSKEIIEFLKTKTELPIYDIQQESIWSYDRKYLDRMPIKYSLNSFYNHDEKFFIAENILKIYENAYCVVTDRVHCSFPCLAFKTPVLFINSASFGRERLQGMEKLLLETSFEGYKENYEIFNVDNPPKNSDNYLKLRKALMKKTKEFTGYMNDSYDSNYSDEYIIDKQTLLWSKTALASRRYMGQITYLTTTYEDKIANIKDKNNLTLEKRDKKIASKNKIINKQKEEIKKKNDIIKHQEKIIDEIQNSKSWKLTKPIRKITNSFRK